MDSTEIYTSLLDSRPMRILQAGFRMWGADVLNGRPFGSLVFGVNRFGVRVL